MSIAFTALAAVARYPDERTLQCSDLVLAALSEAARHALEELMRTEGYEYQSEFARRHRAEGKAEGIAVGKAEGKAEGEARALLTVLDARGIALSEEERAQILASTDLAEIERWLRRAPSVSRAGDLFD